MSAEIHKLHHSTTIASIYSHKLCAVLQQFTSIYSINKLLVTPVYLDIIIVPTNRRSAHQYLSHEHNTDPNLLQ